MNDIVACARGLIGVRWRHQGRSEHGLDCGGLVVVVAQRTRGSTVDVSGYTRQARDESMLATCEAHLQRIQLSAARPGDVMVFGLGDSRHVGIIGDYVHGGLSLIHAYLVVRKVVETRLDDTWRARARAAYRFPETM